MKTKLPVIHKDFEGDAYVNMREFLNGASSVRNYFKEEDNWWNSDNEIHKEENTTIYCRKVKVKNGVNKAGEYTQTAILINDKVILVCGAVTEIIEKGKMI